MLFKFESKNLDGALCTVECEALTWMEALDYFVKFMKGSGYSLDNNSVGVNTEKHFVDEIDLVHITTFSEE